MVNEGTELILEDNGRKLTFEIKKMPATQAEDFLYRLIGLAGRNLDLNASIGWREIVKALSSSKHEESKELLDQLLFQCYKKDGNALKRVSYDDLDGYITSPLTLMKLRIESAKESFGFFTDLNLLGSLGVQNSKQTAEKSEE